MALDPYGETFVKLIVHQYLLALNTDPSVRQVVVPPPRNANPIPDRIFASDLGYCPLKSALKRSGEQPRFPDLAPDAQPSLIRRFAMANRAAEMVQESFLHLAQAQPHYYQVHAEYPIYLGNVNVSGRIDLMFFETSSNIANIYEIKQRNGPLEPKLADCWQLMTYIFAFDPYAAGRLIVIGDSALEMLVCSLENVSDVGGGSFLLTDELGGPLSLPWNRVGEITVDRYEELLDEQVRYTEALRAHEPIEIPIMDFMNHPEGWQCYQNAGKDYPNKKLGTPGHIVPRCEYNCHFRNMNAIPYWKREDNSYSLTDPAEEIPF